MLHASLKSFSLPFRVFGHYFLRRSQLSLPWAARGREKSFSFQLRYLDIENPLRIIEIEEKIATV